MNIQFTQGDTVAIPAGCTAEIKDGVITFSPQQEFKDGDILAVGMWNKTCPFIYAGEDNMGRHKFYAGVDCDGDLVISYEYDRWGTNPLRLATEEEKQKLFDLMKAAGFRWNTAEKRVEKVRWRAEKNETYFTIFSDLSISDTKDLDWESDNRYHNLGNYFRTRGQAKAAAEAIKETLRKFHEEND